MIHHQGRQNRFQKYRRVDQRDLGDIFQSYQKKCVAKRQIVNVKIVKVYRNRPISRSGHCSLKQKHAVLVSLELIGMKARLNS